MDPLFIAAGIKTAVDVDDGTRQTLEAAARHFLEAGGTLTLQDWGTMSIASRAAFVRANQDLQAERILRAALATTPEGAAEAVRDLDDGQTASDVAVAKAAKRAAEKIGKRGRG